MCLDLDRVSFPAPHAWISLSSPALAFFIPRRTAAMDRTTGRLSGEKRELGPSSFMCGLVGEGAHDDLKKAAPHSDRKIAAGGR